MGYIRWLGHASFEIKLKEKVVLIDPWISGNPVAPITLEELTAPDVVLVTHYHGDHYADATKICRKFNATLVSIYEIAQHAAGEGISKTVGMNIGGVANVEGLEIVMTPALHSSEIGSPVGYIVAEGNTSVYHAGDTGLFYDIKLYAELYPIDIALVPIGGYFTMNSRQAAKFISLFSPKVAIPMHYNTFPAIRQDPKKFEEYVKQYSPATKVVILKPGEKWEISL
ncbi:MAG: metal-dependent hydrolase [Thermofilum sp. ex4484_79]|nr:MAG: metal-dependent hydrolase [Thermofilum sp. ex4484_79]